MANPYHSLRQAVREAFARAPSQHDEPLPEARIGSTIRIRLPNDWTAHTAPIPDGAALETERLRGLAGPNGLLVDTATGEIQPLAPTLHVRWMDIYHAETDRIETRVSVSTRELTMPLGALGTNFARREFFLQHYRVQYDELCRRAREEPGECFHYITYIPDAALQLRLPQEAYNRAPLPPPAYAPAPWIERERAEKRSMELLYDWLSDAQRKELALEGYFTITGESSGKRYQVHKAHSFGLRELDGDGNVIASYCVVPAGTHALGDTMLAQKIWMETDEETTLARANRMPLVMIDAPGQEVLNAARMYPDA